MAREQYMHQVDLLVRTLPFPEKHAEQRREIEEVVSQARKDSGGDKI